MHTHTHFGHTYPLCTHLPTLYTLTHFVHTLYTLTYFVPTFPLCTHLPHFVPTYPLCTHLPTLYTLTLSLLKFSVRTLFSSSSFLFSTHFAHTYPLCTHIPTLHTRTHFAHTYPLTVEVLRQDFVLLQQLLVLLLQGLHFAGRLHPFLGCRPQQCQLCLQLGQLRLLLFQVLSSMDGNR